MIIGKKDIKDIVKNLDFKIDKDKKTIYIVLGRKYQEDKLSKAKLKVKQYEIVLAMADLFGLYPEK